MGCRGHIAHCDVERSAGERQCRQKDGKTAVVHKHINGSYIWLEHDNHLAFGLQLAQEFFGKVVQSQNPNKDACVKHKFETSLSWRTSYYEKMSS